MKIFDEKYYDIPEDKRSYTLVAEDLEKSGIFDNNDSDIVHNPTRKVLTNDELAEIQAKKGKKIIIWIKGVKILWIITYQK